MTDKPRPDPLRPDPARPAASRPEDPFVVEVRRQAARAGRARQLTLWQGLGLVGTVGWMVAAPAVGGALCGRWLDTRYGTRVFWTLSLLFSGLLLGSLSAWRQIKRELDL